jgi:glycosyltransferase involved in cell wall biosynthesis
MVRALRQEGVDASLLTTNDDGEDTNPELPTGHWQQWQDIPVLAFPRWSPAQRSLREFAISPALNLWLQRHRHDYDLLHIHALFSYPSTTAMVQARRAGIPYLLRTIGQLSPWSLSQSAGRKRLMLRLIERRNLQAAAALHFTTDAERDETAPLGLTTPSLVLPLGVSAPEPPEAGTADGPAFPGSAGEPVRFLFLSRLHPKKQLEHLIDACALLQHQHPAKDWVLQIAGDGEASYRTSLQQRCQRQGIDHRCQWLGFVSGEAKWSLLRKADWFVLPSAAENFGIAAVEALAAATPVILSPQVAISTAVRAAGAGLLSDSAPQSLATTLGVAVQGPPLAMRLAARELATATYSWPAIAQRLHNHYIELIEHKLQR